MTDIIDELKKANEKGLNPPQNWTHRAIDEIEKLSFELLTAKERIAELEFFKENHKCKGCLGKAYYCGCGLADNKQG